MTGEEDILRVLRSDPAGYHSGQDLAGKIGVSRTTVWKRIRKLRNMGFRIEGSPSRGYRLEGVEDLLKPDLIRKQLKTRTVGKVIEYRSITGSTNTDAFNMARDGAKDGTCVVADAQTAGRGRLGRKWMAPPGTSILTSIILRPDIPPVHAPIMTLAAGVAVAKAITRVTGLDPRIKWPNDILIGGLKVAGILTEMLSEADVVHFIVLGIGINVNVDKKHMPGEILKIATSLSIETGRTVSRNQVLMALYEEVEGAYRRFLRQGPRIIIEQWEDIARIRGRMVSATAPSEKKVTGKARGLDDDGALLIEGSGGNLYRISVGDVTFE